MLNTQWVAILSKEKVLTYADVPILFTGIPRLSLLNVRTFKKNAEGKMRVDQGYLSTKGEENRIEL